MRHKHCGRIRTRGCAGADGRKQQANSEEHEAKSPSVAIESVFHTSTTPTSFVSESLESDDASLSEELVPPVIVVSDD